MVPKLTVEADCPVCGVRLSVPVLDVPGPAGRRTADLQWLIAHFRTHPSGGDGDRLLRAA